jgi:hypothetical protein
VAWGIAKDAGLIWHSWSAFWLLFAEAKSDRKNHGKLKVSEIDKKKNNVIHKYTLINAWGWPPQTRLTFSLGKKK